ncbi:MAG: DUF2071 domain-containing protein [Planctomycetes bacterium]|nr:DUF2071 domain-containing protein [Planctomycetota bacterium]
MPMPTVHGVIARRLLVNFRVDPQVLQRQLPAPFRVAEVAGWGIAGVCLIRLVHERPRFWPRWLGLASENAAHRIAVKVPTGDGDRPGVYVVRRDTDSRWNRLVGGRLFPGVHHAATFTVDEDGGRIALALQSRDGATAVEVRGRAATALPADSVFADVAAASAFFEQGALGWSPARAAGCFDCLELRSFGWRVEPLAVEHVRSSWLDDPARFPPGSVRFDSALRMRHVDHEWRAHRQLRAGLS